MSILWTMLGIVILGYVTLFIFKVFISVFAIVLGFLTLIIVNIVFSVPFWAIFMLFFGIYVYTRRTKEV
jgi:hypothetical protein